MEEQSPVCSWQYIPGRDEVESLQKMRVRASLLSSAAEEETAQPRGLLIGILLKSSPKEGLKTSLQPLKLFREEKEARIHNPRGRLMQEQEAEVSETFSYGSGTIFYKCGNILGKIMIY